MNSFRPAGAVALVFLLAACGEKQNTAPENQTAATGAPAPVATDKVYSGTGTGTGTGTVKSITGEQVAIAHGPIAGIGWPAMTMTFTVPPDMAGGVKVGDKVDFSFRQDGSAYVLTSVKPQ